MLLDGPARHDADLAQIDGVVDLGPGQFLVAVFGPRAAHGVLRGFARLGRVDDEPAGGGDDVGGGVQDERRLIPGQGRGGSFLGGAGGLRRWTIDPVSHATGPPTAPTVFIMAAVTAVCGRPRPGPSPTPPPITRSLQNAASEIATSERTACRHPRGRPGSTPASTARHPRASHPEPAGPGGTSRTAAQRVGQVPAEPGTPPPRATAARP